MMPSGEEIHASELVHHHNERRRSDEERESDELGGRPG
jgi:hypothetical protein